MGTERNREQWRYWRTGEEKGERLGISGKVIPRAPCFFSLSLSLCLYGGESVNPIETDHIQTFPKDKPSIAYQQTLFLLRGGNLPQRRRINVCGQAKPQKVELHIVVNLPKLNLGTISCVIVVFHDNQFQSDIQWRFSLLFPKIFSVFLSVKCSFY